MLEDHPRVIALITNPKGQVILAILTLCAIIIFVASFYIFQPYDGMAIYKEAPLSEVFEVYPDGPADFAGVEIGDRILAIDGRLVDPLRSEPRYRPGIRPGEVVEYEFIRDGAQIELPITIGSYFDNLPLFGAYLGVQFLSFGLWVTGLVLALFVPQDDVRARLLSLGFLLAGLTAAVGGASGWSSFWGANTIQKVLLSLLAPIIVAAHLTFPSLSLQKYRRRIISVTLALAIILSLLVMIDDWILKPGGTSLLNQHGLSLRPAVLVFFMIAWLMAIVLLIYNRLRSPDPEIQRQTGLIIWGMLLGIGPFFVFTLLPYVLFGEEFLIGAYTILFLILLPLAYAYVIFQRKLLKVDFIINRILVWFILILLILMVSMLILGAIPAVFNLSMQLSIVAGLAAALGVLLFAPLSKIVQEQVNRVLYGSHYDFATVTSSLSNQLAQTLDRERLVELLSQSLPQQMGIQRAVLLLSDGDRLDFGGKQNNQGTYSLNDDLCKELLKSRRPMRAAHLWDLLQPGVKANWAEFDWGQVYTPLIFKGDLHGILILGQRARGDVYSYLDLHIIATVAEQGALAATNVLLFEKHRKLAQQLVRSTEEERKRLSSDLHDTVLQELFFIKQGLHKDLGNLELLDYLEESIQNLRRAIKAQRPPLLDQGLPLALQGLVDDMQKIAGSRTSISWKCNLNGAPGLMDEQSTSIFRIAQEALNNAVKHAGARHIEVGLEQDENRMTRLTVIDDGEGSSWIYKDGNLHQNHFGLVLMQERAVMIDARLHILAVPGGGTTIELEVSPLPGKDLRA